MFTDFFSRKVVHIGFTHFDKLFGIFVQLLKIVGSVKLSILPVAAKPVDVFADGVDVFLFFLGGIGVVKAQVAQSIEFIGNTEIQADGFGMAQMQISVGLRRKARMNLAAVTAGGVVFHNARPDKVHSGLVCRLRRSGVGRRTGGTCCGRCGGGDCGFCFGGHNALHCSWR